MLQASWYTKALGLVGQPVGVSLANGQGVTGVLCSVTGGTVVLQEYLYQSQFATKQYPFNSVQDINPFPGCSIPGPLY
jgi:hypothetical protein